MTLQPTRHCLAARMFWRNKYSMARNTRTFTDFDPSFEPHPTTGDLLIRTDERAVKFAIKALILTQNYERPFHPEIGTPIHRLLFENYDDMFVIVMRQAIIDVVTEYEPRASIIDVDIDPSPDNNSIRITVRFVIRNTDKPLDVGITLERTR